MELNFVRTEIFVGEGGTIGEARIRTSDISAWADMSDGTRSGTIIILKNGEKVFTPMTIDKLDSKITRAEAPTFK
jgi:hypothetical protein